MSREYWDASKTDMILNEILAGMNREVPDFKIHAGKNFIQYQIRFRCVPVFTAHDFYIFIVVQIHCINFIEAQHIFFAKLPAAQIAYINAVCHCHFLRKTVRRFVNMIIAGACAVCYPCQAAFIYFMAQDAFCQRAAAIIAEAYH